MTNRFFLLLFINIVIGSVAAQGQITNGSFTQGSNGLDGWSVAGAPTVGTWSPGVGATTDVQLISTDADHTTPDSADAPGSDPVGTVLTSGSIDAVLGVTLPNSDIVYAPTDGQAIYQDFSLSQTGTLTFSYESSTDDYGYQDEVGYVINGTYTELAHSIGFTTVTVDDVNAGPNELGFVSYNTNDNQYNTYLEVSDVSIDEAPEPATVWLLVASLALAPLLRTARRRMLPAAVQL